ncbi:hypothetical protein GOBAR_DD28602 [Gossypium barbadense]|nr:hypothetical protein GOBAR_DD28602 [Gossypium barbadense]
MEASGGNDQERRDEISLLAKELVQLSVKSSMVVPNSKPTLICTVWTEKMYNPDSFRAHMKGIWKIRKKFEIQVVGQNLFLRIFELEEDLELILEGRPWLFQKNLILFDRLCQAMERNQIKLTSSPFWIKIESCSPEFDKKDLLHAIGGTFSGVLRSEVSEKFCRLRINLDAQKPLRRGIFVSTNYVSKVWIPFKYENLPLFCFGCGRMGYGMSNCTQIPPAKKRKVSENPPYSVALKAESRLIGKESMKFNSLMKQTGVQSSYNSIKHAEDGYTEVGGSQENLSLKEGGEMTRRVQTGAITTKAESYMRKRKSLDADLTSCFQESVNRDGIKRLKRNTQEDYDTGPSVMMTDNAEQNEVKPTDRFVKINFDAAYERGQNKAAIGVARDKEGSVLLSCSKVHQWVSSTFGAEAIACRKALQIGVHMKWDRVIIEGDSLSIIKKCKTKNPDKSLVSAFIHDIHQLLVNFKECKFEHIPRSTNSLAHILASEAFKSNRGDNLVKRVPGVAEIQEEIERVGEPD